MSDRKVLAGPGERERF